MNNPIQKALLLTGGVCLAAVGFALYAQHGWGMQPCPWCIIQRLIYIVLGVICALGGLLPARYSRGFAGAGLLTALGGVAVAGYQTVVASKQLSCNLTAADKFINWSGLNDWLPEIFSVRATCADASASKLLGIPFEQASGILFVLLALWLVMIVARRWRR